MGIPNHLDKIPQICKVGMVEANIIKMLMTEVQMIGEGGGGDAEPDQQLLVPSSGWWCHMKCNQSELDFKRLEILKWSEIKHTPLRLLSDGSEFPARASESFYSICKIQGWCSPTRAEELGISLWNLDTCRIL